MRGCGILRAASVTPTLSLTLTLTLSLTLNPKLQARIAADPHFTICPPSKFKLCIKKKNHDDFVWIQTPVGVTPFHQSERHVVASLTWKQGANSLKKGSGLAVA